VDILIAVGSDTLTITAPSAASLFASGEYVSLAFDAERLWCLPSGDATLPEASAVSPELAA
ncbi:hypothetical protein, partial [Lactobacillus crispatus]|uniref:hypothetical protein n=1 Tax=Lactobacillus crispatus TaxID=47770 RepID=UPI00197BAF48